MKKWILWFCVLLLCVLPVSAERIPLTDGDGASVLLYMEWEEDVLGNPVYPEEYAGHWTEDGKLHLALVDPDAEMLERYQLLFGDMAGDVVYHAARYSMNDLELLGREYIERMGEYTTIICGWTIQKKHNCVALEFVGDAAELQNAMALAEVPEGLFFIGIHRGMATLPEVVPPDVGSPTTVMGAFRLLSAALPTLAGDGNAYPDTYAGCWAEDGTLYIGLTTRDAEERARYEQVLAGVTVPYSFFPCDYSCNQLMRLKDAVTEQLMPDPRWGIVAVSVDITDCLVRVASTNGQSAELEQALYQIAEAEGLGDSVVLLEEGIVDVMAQVVEQVEYAPETDDFALHFVLWAVCAGSVMLYIRKRKHSV